MTYKVGTIAMIYGLVEDPEFNGRCVTLIQPIQAGNDSFVDPADGITYYVEPDTITSWLCDDGWVYSERNLLPIGDKDNEIVKDKEKDYEY